MKEKPFKTIQEQVELLASRGILITDETFEILMREGYYSIINGYKEPFIDHEATKLAKDDRYIDGTSFSNIYSLFKFDRDLRELTFHYLLRVEAIMKTVCSYTFAEHHGSHSDYLMQTSFATKDEYKSYGLNKYNDNFYKLQNALHNALNYPKNESIEYYKKEYGDVPIWVLMNTLSFGNVEHFFNLMKPEEKKLVCKRIALMPHYAKRKYLEPSKLHRSIDVLVKFRNKCAHDERLYCAVVDKRNPVDFVDCIEHTSLFLSSEEVIEFIQRTLELINNYATVNSQLEHIMDKTGLSVVRINKLLDGGNTAHK